MPRTKEQQALFSRFKQLLDSGLPARAAAIQAGYSKGMADSKSYLLARRAWEARKLTYLRRVRRFGRLWEP